MCMRCHNGRRSGPAIVRGRRTLLRTSFLKGLQEGSLGGSPKARLTERVRSRRILVAVRWRRYLGTLSRPLEARQEEAIEITREPASTSVADVFDLS